ncbi:hypothetical protein FHX44_11904 [Pseudonocardia hierapolitana]|uniref:Alpha/beta hydrolase family protein n=1 Tax=Pseudonocardia hierapolitana TaxID=1128676 RepID=A0A561SJH1_9PSEU|nr:hypothetical protein [Pseudonocardia hierapolitana]TWF75020.1 hypothetical protein FHX44_11904 [Pseudonocardia hierapolitana]
MNIDATAPVDGAASLAAIDAMVRGVRIGYETFGEGPDLVWGHGLSQSRALEAEAPLVDWSRIAARVTRYDARGHGGSGSTPDLSGYTWAALAQDQRVAGNATDLTAQVGIGRGRSPGRRSHERRSHRR